MQLEKERRRVSIICVDGTSIKGTVCINAGERLLDYINDVRESFIALTDAEFYNTEDVQSFKIASKLLVEKKFAILNKASIKWVEEVGD